MAAHWLEEVGLPAEVINRYPHEFPAGSVSGCVTRCSNETEVRRFDEAVSALDVTIRRRSLIC